MSSVLFGLESKKRKRQDVGTQPDSISTKTIVLQSAGSNHDPLTPRIELRPMLLIPREYLPFAFTKRDNDHRPSLFKSHIGVLERDDQSIPRVLVAASTSDNALFAVEKIQDGVYGLCPLQNWIALDELGSKPAKKIKSSHDVKQEVRDDCAPWWDRAAVSVASLKRPQTTESKTPRLSMTAHGKSADDSSKGAGYKQAAIEESPNPIHSTEPIPTHEEIVDALRSKYLEALYISKTSLAFFAKGPLARARHFLQQTANEDSTQNLVNTLRDMLTTIAIGDKKYASTLPDLVKGIPYGALEDEQDVMKQTRTMCKRGKKRKKLNKNGLFPFEEEHIVQWWFEKEKHAESADLDTTHSERIKSSLAKQRTRETQLQIMLILEIMAEQSAIDLPQKDELPNRTKDQNEESKKAKKPLELEAVLDIHVDRLCIWQTTQSEFDADDSLLSAGSSHGSSCGNALQDFCTEVLVPFFASRIPQIFAQLCKKMGTVGVTSPARPVIKRVSSAQNHPKPGAAVSRRNLQRVSTDGKTGNTKAPSLARSATDSAATRVKREASEISLEDIPVHKPRAQPNLRYAQREVDLDALTKATEEKLKRKALVEQELQSAINVLKKPNSRMAVKEYVDFSDGRAAGKPKRKIDPVQHDSAPAPLVKATPRVNRVRRDYDQDTRQVPDVGIPPSSDPRVPSSTHRPDAQLFERGLGGRNSSAFLPAGATFSKRNHVAATPTRAAGRYTDRLDPSALIEDAAEQDGITESPVMSRSSLRDMTQTPTKPLRCSLKPPAHTAKDIVAQTPAKKAEQKTVPDVAPNKAPDAQPGGSQSTKQVLTSVQEDEEEYDIYKALGWDD